MDRETLRAGLEAKPKYTRSVEDFLKAVFTLQRNAERVATGALAEHLRLKPPSVTDMARRLHAEGLLDYRKHRGVRLTSAGTAEALRVVRRHRLIELYLVTELGYAPYEVHDEAERLEHAVSDRFVQEIAHKLGDPQLDPHGDPIPASDGTIVNRDLMPLSALPVNTTGKIARFTTLDQDMHRFILERGFYLDSEVEVLARDPFDGPIKVLVDGHERVIGHQVAAYVLVEVTGSPATAH